MEEFNNPVEEPIEEPVVEAVPDNSFFNKIKGAFSSGLALAIAICVSVLFVITLIGNAAVALFPLLLTIAAWIIYAGAKKDEVKINGYKIVSGVAKAQSVICWILFAVILLTSVLFFLIPSRLGKLIDDIDLDELMENPKAIEELTLGNGLVDFDISGDEFAELLEDENAVALLTYVAESGIGLVFYVVAGILLVFAILCAVFAFLYGNLNKFTKSLCVSLDSDKDYLVKQNFAKGFMMTLGIFCVIGLIGSFSNPLNLVTTALEAALYFMCFALIKNNFIDLK